MAEPKGPDTLNPIGIAIIHHGLSSRRPMPHVAPGPSRGPSAKNLSSLCTLGGSRLAKQAFPPRTPHLPPGVNPRVVSAANGEANGDYICSVIYNTEDNRAQPYNVAAAAG